ncbi:hypothetical protein BGW36DRAFT_392021 [Talaromyces proteolyticus]|uniref:Uncharacterized protein n=1 Tax=Talaromyces proteolyticus TaxID=1131652 RepID=A0AAD4PSD9_9EURO|nr:uncharacterized protein BGW36DRAFT_392021 [Talaromyces proteolyticus]KAH8688680.1 hypothetical protein BGW36DRAFT_392021 [Talaromyces proteolyticus]
MNDWTISFFRQFPTSVLPFLFSLHGAKASTSILINIFSSPNLGILNNVQTGRCPGTLFLIFGTKYCMMSSIPTV